MNAAGVDRVVPLRVASLRIALVAPPIEAVPPLGYGGTERIVGELARALDARGHDVTTFASGDSLVPGRLIPTVAKAIRSAAFNGDPATFFEATVRAVLDRTDEFDLVHAHLDRWNLDLLRRAPIPVVATFHGRLDTSWAVAGLSASIIGHGSAASEDRVLVAVSHDQTRVVPNVDWTVIHHGLTFPTVGETGPEHGDYFAFVGRMAPEKGILDAIEVSRLTGRPLLIAAKTPATPMEVGYRDAVVRPALDRADVTLLGELGQDERQRMVAGGHAALIPSAWPEPFGLVVVEALGAGTPVLARRAGAIPELVRDGIDGFIGDDAAQLAFFDRRIEGLDRSEIRHSAMARFSVDSMVDRYEAVYRRAVGILEPAATRR